MPWPKEIPAERYPSDLTDEEWQIIEPLLKPKKSNCLLPWMS